MEKAVLPYYRKNSFLNAVAKMKIYYLYTKKTIFDLLFAFSLPHLLFRALDQIEKRRSEEGIFL